MGSSKVLKKLKSMGSKVGPREYRIRKSGHETFDRLWKDSHMTRNEAYAWISKRMGFQVHFSAMTPSQVEKARELSEELLKKMRGKDGN